MAIAAPWVIGAIIEGIKDAAIALGVVVTGAVAADQVQKARARSRDLADAAAADTCVSCRRGPCGAEAAGIPGVRYQGGAHRFMQLPPNDGLESHHMPSAYASPLGRDDGPAIKMEPDDHKLTASYGRSGTAIAYRAAQERLIRQGNFTAAFQMDVADVTAKFGAKYAGAIAQAARYLACLKRLGLVR